MSEHLVKMDDDYAKLSLFAGIFAREADHYLRRKYFIPMIRQHVWTLTWEKLAAWKAEAIRMGVPARKLEPDPKTIKALPGLIAQGRRLQEARDRMNPGGIVH